MGNYVGITIGPIFDTINEAASPAALWFTSTMFSDITRRLCLEIKKIDEASSHVEIFSPAFDNDDTDGIKDGIGKYHDRIIFLIEEDDSSVVSDKLDKIIMSVKENTINVFPEETYADRENAQAFLRKYLVIEYVIMNEKRLKKDENCILALSGYLDELELMRLPFSNKDNLFEKMLNGVDKDKRNQLIKKSSLITKDVNIINKDGNIKSIEDIAGVTDKKNEFKHTKYYAVVSADGDGMGKFLKELKSDNKLVTEFSKKCLEYDKKAATLIHEFGGMPIYAGGDDLLFLAPIINKETKKSIFSLCKEINNSFKELIKSGPTISFGISIQYYKFPLYEALKRSQQLLESAKNDINGTKNRIAMNLEKHSGQTIGLIIGNEFVEKFENFINTSSENADGEKYDMTIKSIVYRLHEFRELFQIIDQREINNSEIGKDAYFPWDNMFDNDGQKYAEEYLHKVQKWYYNHIIKSRVETLDGSDSKIQQLASILRFAKFLIERGDDNE